LNLVVIGSGDPGHFKAFREKTGYNGLLYTDPSLKTFSVLGFSNGLIGFMSIGSVFKAASAWKQGHRQGSIQGSTLQLGGAVVVNTAGTVIYFFAGKKAGDHPDVDDLLMALEK
jgi:hypothetical protein